MTSRPSNGHQEPGPFPFNADLALRFWMKMRLNDKWYDPTRRAELRKDVLFWIGPDEPSSWFISPRTGA